MAISEEDRARWRALVDAVPAGPWHVGWDFDEGVFPAWYTAPPPTEPADTGIEGWPPLVDTVAAMAAGITEIGQQAAMALAEAATTALPALVAEVDRLRAALAAIVAEADKHPEPTWDERAQGWVDTEGHYLGEDNDVDFGRPEAWAEAAQMARAALGEAVAWVREGETRDGE